MASAKSIRILAPYPGIAHASTPSVSAHIVDNAAEGVAWAFDARTTDPITHLGFRFGTRTGVPPTYIAGLEGLTSVGLPDATYKVEVGNCTATFTPPNSTAWDGTWQWIELDNPYTPDLGERLCFSVRYGSGTIDGSNNGSFTTGWTSMSPTLQSFPYAIRNTGGTWAVQTGSTVFGVRTANDRYGCVVPNMYNTRSAATIGHAQAAKINLSSAFGATYRVAGIRATASLAAATSKTPLAKIWQGTTTLASKAMPVAQMGSATFGAYRTVECLFEDSVTLNFGSDYYFGFEVADTVNSGVLLYGTQFADAADNSDDGGSMCTFATFDGTAWTDDATVRPWIELIMDDIAEPTGGGGGSIILPRAMSGGYSA